MAIGTFLYPALVDKLNQSQTPADVYTKTESDAKYAKLASANTFTTTNTFNGTTNFHNRIDFKNTTNNNGFFIENFDYNRENYTALKFTKNPSAAVLIFEVNYNQNTATISSPTTNNHLYINNLANPTGPNSAANKAYVDSRTTTYKWEGTVGNGTTQNLETISWDKHIIGAVVFRKRSDNQWFCINNNMTQQLYRDNGTGQFKLYGNTATGSPSFNDDYKVYITYIN